MRILFLILTTLFFQTGTSFAQTSLSKEERQRLMSLDFEAFDQDMQGGWRTFANEEQFELAADLIVEYLGLHQDLDDGQLSVMNFHVGQMYALAGENAKAVPYMKASKKTNDVMAWNAYVDATIAFLEKNKEMMEIKRKELEIGSVMPAANNKNLILIKKLEANFDKSYLDAIRSQ